jgi:phosphoribosylaminoimidazole carboxylase PurE protein
MKKAQVAVIMGSDSDLPVMRETVIQLKELGISYEVKILSAHRSPEETSRYAQTAKKKGLKVIIAGAGGAAHLAGVVASHTILPVIGIPLESSPLKGIDALCATVQMPGGVPVATMAVGVSGAKNAAILAAEILALNDKQIAARLEHLKKEMARKIKKKNITLKCE